MNPFIWTIKGRTTSYSKSVPIRDVALNTCWKQWTIGICSESGSGTSVLVAWRDDDDDDDDDFLQKHKSHYCIIYHHHHHRVPPARISIGLDCWIRLLLLCIRLRTHPSGRSGYESKPSDIGSPVMEIFIMQIFTLLPLFELWPGVEYLFRCHLWVK